MTLGEHIKREREQREWSKSKLSHKAHISPHTLARLENDEVATPTINVLVAIADALSIEVSEFVPYIREQNKRKEE